MQDRKSTRLNSSHLVISYAVFCLKKKKDYEILVQRGDSGQLQQIRPKYSNAMMSGIYRPRHTFLLHKVNSAVRRSATTAPATCCYATSDCRIEMVRRSCATCLHAKRKAVCRSRNAYRRSRSPVTPTRRIARAP